MKSIKSNRLSYAEERDRRSHAAVLFKRGYSPGQVAKEIGVARQTASRWYRRWKREGPRALRTSGLPGVERKLSQENLRQLHAMLLEGPRAHGFAYGGWTLVRIAKVIRRRWRTSYSLSGVRRLLRRLGWVHQRPTTCPTSTNAFDWHPPAKHPT